VDISSIILHFNGKEWQENCNVFPTMDCGVLTKKVWIIQKLMILNFASWRLQEKYKVFRFKLSFCVSQVMEEVIQVTKVFFRKKRKKITSTSFVFLGFSFECWSFVFWEEEDPSYWGYSVIQRDEWGHPIAPEACEAWM